MTPLLACALGVEERAARRGGARTVRVGLGASLGAPAEPFISFGLAGALTDTLAPGDLVVATRVADAEGRIVWQGEPVPIHGARHVTLCTPHAVVDHASARRSLAERTGAEVVDLESGTLATSEGFLGCVRAISDTPGSPVGILGRAATSGGDVAWGVVVRAFVTQPRTALRAAGNARRAFAALERAAAELAS